jgi:carbon monoxide dehydrogenase subunit G
VELTNEFRVGVPVEDAWAILTDVERIAPCMPGAQLQEVEGDQYRGIVKVKVGPITAQYKGTASFQDRDEAAHRVVLKAEGRDTRGQGNANATVTATLVPDGDSTKVTVVTDLTITGKVAQFGRGVLADVSSKLLGQFVDNLERDVLSGAGGAASSGASAPATQPDVAATTTAAAPTATATATAPENHGPGVSTNGSVSPPGVRRIDHPEPKPVDLMATAGSPVAKRAIPLVGGLLAVFLVWRFLARRRA